MRTHAALRVLLIGCGTLALVASGAAAEWLVTADGSRIEIAGPWEVEGRMVTFTLPNGTLGSMPLSAVDLEASEALAAEMAAAARPSEEETERPKAVMVITDADVRRATSTGSAGDEESSAPPEEVNPIGLRVSSWRESVDLASTSVRIVGRLQNPTDNPATSIDVAVELYDESGELLERSSARLDRGFLNPGATVGFTADFVDTLSYDDVRFDVRSRGFMANPPAEEEPGEDAGGSEVDEGSI